MRIVPLLCCALLFHACDAAKDDLEAICHARARANVPVGADAATQERVITGYLMLAVHSPKVKRLMATMGSKTPAEKAKALRAEALSAGITACPLADEFDAPVAAPVAKP